MAPVHGHSLSSWLTIWTAVVTTLLLLVAPVAAEEQNITWVKYNGEDGTVWLDDARRPALYTDSFGDCQGESLINVTRFDAAYYKDNMTVLFHLEGNSALTNESLMLYIGVFAYGELRFNLTFNPCNANIDSLCPLNSSIPITAAGIIPVAPSDVANIPSIALSIPDFEGQAILRIFANSTESQIACFSAVVTNGASFSHPAAVSSILGVFTVVALVASVATTIYGNGLSETRKHYAHSISLWVVFSVFQHIFFTGGLSMNWPSVLVAFWSNYAWSAGIIYNQQMQNSINQFIGDNRGNISMVGAAPSGENVEDLGGGYQISQIYKRSATTFQQKHDTGLGFNSASLAHAIQRRATSGSPGSWYGDPVLPGLPLPGNFSGFAGTLSELDIPASNAFMTGLLWFLILVASVAGGIVLMKWSIEGLAAVKLVRTERLAFFRRHWLRFVRAAVLRSCYIAFFMMMFLTMFQFTLGGATGVKAVAAVVFALFVVCMLGLCGYALWHRKRLELLPEDHAQESESQAEKPGHSSWFKSSHRRMRVKQGEAPKGSPLGRFFQKHFPESGRVHVHDDESYIVRFGFLTSRFRRSKWWFFSVWVIYELVRAAFYGGAAGYAMVQVFGLLAWEIISLVLIVVMRPFESNRLNFLMVYLLGFSKVVTVALSSAFDPRFGLSRIMTTVIGVVIIVIQGVLTIALMVAIVFGAIGSYMSLTRYEESMKPRSWIKSRARYFAHVDQKATDRPKPPPPAPPVPEEPKAPYFSVSAVRRQPKIEDHDVGGDVLQHPTSARESVDPTAGQSVGNTKSRLTPRTSMEPEFGATANQYSHSRSQSMRSVSKLPYGARVHRTSWSMKDFQDLDNEQGPSNLLNSRMSLESIRDISNRHRSSSLRLPSRNGATVSGLTTPPNEPNPQSSRTRHQRSASNPSGPKRNSSIVNEEKENDPDAIQNEAPNP